MTSDARVRVVLLVLYLATLLAVQNTFISSGFSFDNKIIWLISGFISLLFGSRIIFPYFTPPAGSLTNAATSLLAIFPALSGITSWTPDAWVMGIAVGFFVIVIAVSLLVLIFRPSPGVEPGLVWGLSERAVKGLGSPNIIFTALIIVTVWLFHRTQAIEVFVILSTLAVITIIRPLEAIVDYAALIWHHKRILRRDEIVGIVAAHQSPNIVLIRQSEAKTVKLGTPMVVADQHGPEQLGIALNYVGRDEGNLLRVLTAPLPKTLASYADQLPAKSQDAIALEIKVPANEASQIPSLQWIGRLCGIVDSETNIEHIQFEVINDSGLAEGGLIEVRIGDQRCVIYQVVDGLTREEIVQQKNKYGYARAKARKIGAWDAEALKFIPVPWMPRMNAPVFMLDNEATPQDDDCVGHFPSTPYGVRIDPSECVTHNTAILGILGVGKSYLSIELVERMIAQGIKVICIDLTNQYEHLLADFLDTAHEERVRNALVAAGKGGAPHKNKEQGGSRASFSKAVVEQMRHFMASSNDHYLWVLNPAQFFVTKQVSGMFNGDADLAHLTAAEITALFSNAALMVCQELGMTDSARLCLVYEEAHSLVPEWNSVAAEGDRLATATSARAILQGRKYGLGCLLITQRTANVTKTILNQCNTIFAMRTFDDTGKEFLGNYIGSDYATVLPSLQPRHAVVFGKASSCENPVLIRLNDQDAFRRRFRSANPPRQPQVTQIDVEAIAAANSDRPEPQAKENGGGS